MAQFPRATVQVSSAFAIFSSNVCNLSNRVQSSPVKKLANPLVRIAVGVLVIALIVFFYRRILHLNPATVGFTFLLAVLVISAAWGLRYAIAISVTATLAYNFFFL